MMNKHKESFTDFQILKSQLATAINSGYPTYNVLFTYSIESPIFEKLATAEIGILKDNTIYVIDFFADQTRYNSLQPIVEKIINSFQIIQ